MSNSASMTVEEKLVQSIKTSSLAMLMDDDDAILELTKRAISEALFKERRVTFGSGYNASTTTELSPVVEAARDVAKVVVTSVMMDFILQLMNDPKTLDEIKKATAALLPGVVLGTMGREVIDAQKRIQANALGALANGFMSIQDQQSFNATLAAQNTILNGGGMYSHGIPEDNLSKI